MLRKIFLTMLLSITVITLTARAGEDVCGGITYLGNYYSCENICSTDGNCVWWGYAQRPDLYDDCKGNADLWYGQADGIFNRGSTPYVGSIACFDDLSEWGHVAYVQYVHTDGTFWVSEMGCDAWDDVRYTKYSTSHNDFTGFINDGPVPYRQTQTPQQLVDARETTALDDQNQYGWSESPVTAFGTFSTAGWWFSFINSNPNVYNSTDGTALNCYLALADGGDCNAQECAGIVYDALGGAKYAYMVGWEKWQIWESLTDDLANVSKSCPTSDCYETDDCNATASRIGGPSSALGMPITNSYETAASSDIWRQDFQKGYIQNGTIHCYENCSPGWSSGEIWNNRYSYLFANAYDRNGGARDVGVAQNRVHVSYDNILIQEFEDGADGDGMIMYDQENWDDNPCATNEAYWVYGGIKTYYDNNGGVAQFGSATTDRFESGGTWYQDFKNSSNEVWRVSSSSAQHLGSSIDCGYQSAGGEDAPSGSHYLPIAGKFNTGNLAEVGAYQGNIGRWYIANNNGNKSFSQIYGADENGSWLDNWGTDTAGAYRSIAGDFNNDGLADAGLYQPSIGRWYILYNQGDNTFAQSVGLDVNGSWLDEWGVDSTTNKYKAFAGDFNGDGLCDIGLYQNNIGRWYIAYNQGDKSFVAVAGFDVNGSWLDGWGSTTTNKYYPIAGDFNNDGYCDAGLYQNNIGRWYIIYNRGDSSFSQAYGTETSYSWLDNWGSTSTDVYRPYAGDFNGDGLCDAGLYQPSIGRWYVVYNEGDSSFDASSASGLFTNGSWLDGWGIGTPGLLKVSNSGTIPLSFTLTQNYPNPFNPVTTISYSLPVATHVTLEVFNILGQKVTALVNEQQSAGLHVVTWEADQHASGIYFYRLTTGEAVETKKMLLLK